MRRRILGHVLPLVALLVATMVGLPPAVAAPIDPGTTRPFGPPQGSCYTTMTPTGLAPNQLADVYGLTPLWRAGHQGQGIRVALLDPGELPDLGHVEDFKGCFGISTPVHVHRIGTGSEPTVQGEATLDVEVVLTSAPKLDAVHLFSSRGDVATPLVDLLRTAIDPANTGGHLVDAISVSFGGCETKEDTEHPGYLDAMNAVLRDAADKGITVFFAGGDSGSAACAPHPVRDHDPHAGTAAIGFPGSSPWVVNVGGTQMVGQRPPGQGGAGLVEAEVVWNEPDRSDPTARFAGGGGHSQFFVMPPWQRSFGLSGAMRSTPDVVALAGTPTYSDGSDHGGWLGTSAASPFTAGGWATVLSALRANGLSKPGFLAPILYQLAATDYTDVFRDITIGDNDPWGKVGCCPAATGYDNASGLGSLRFDALATALGAPDASLTASPVAGALPLSVTLDASASTTPGGTITSYAWDTDGDGTTDVTTTAPTVVTTFATAGTKHPSVRITNTFGRTHSASTPVSVRTSTSTDPSLHTTTPAIPRFTG